MKNKLIQLKEMLNLEIEGRENFPTDAPSVVIANHNCLKDIFYVPAALPNNSVSLISSRLVYKNIKERKKAIHDLLYPMPIEAHGGGGYAEICLKYAAKLLRNGCTLSIFQKAHI